MDMIWRYRVGADANFSVGSESRAHTWKAMKENAPVRVPCAAPERIKVSLARAFHTQLSKPCLALVWVPWREILDVMPVDVILGPKSLGGIQVQGLPQGYNVSMPYVQII